MSAHYSQVLIVGAGLAGLSAANLLALRGIDCTLVERRRSSSHHPRARGVNVRSMELLRTVPGLERDLQAAGRSDAENFTITIAESVTGREFSKVVPRGGFDTKRLSPGVVCAAGQDRIEPILARHAESRGVDIRRSTEVVDLVQDDEGATAVVRDRGTGVEQRLRADYVIAADGSRSPTRQRLGIGSGGHGTMSYNISILFEADLGFLDERGFALYYLRNPGFTGAFITTDDRNRGQLSVEFDPNRESAADFGSERCIALVRAALGIPDLGVTILDAMPWEMSSRTADRMRSGRIFLAGDAAHTMPPTGGLGGQTAIQDAADLAWKLALVLRGKASPALLDTYEAERHPVARMTVARQTENYVERMRPDRSELSQAGVETDYLSVAMGYRYRSAAVQDDPGDDGSQAESPIRPSFRAGFRLGHGVLERDGKPLSTLDLVGDGFVLIAGSDGDVWIRAAHAAAAAGLPVAARKVGGDLVDPNGSFAQRARLSPDRALLVRPDGVIAWRFDAGHANPSAALDAALARALCRASRAFAMAA